jgi:putative peptide zinc metalloprotease protein
MPTLAESLTSSTSRPLTLRMRPDLSARRQRYHGRTYWVVKEPVGLNYFRFHEEEYAILCMMDGRSSLEDIKDQFEDEFTPQKITYPDLQQFIGMLHRSGLVISEAAGQGRQLRKRRDQKKRRELLGKMSNIFAIRFRGIDPERILNAMYPYVGWVFSPITMVLVLLFGLSALSLVVVEFDTFRAKLPTFHQFFGPHNWIWMALTLGVVKILHEFGHGLSCKHYGGECHEIGFMFLVFTPCLYCNVSDSWMLPNKWKRAFIGASGMYVEVFLASVATYIWWFSETGLLNQISLSVMFICSVSTLLFNGNPLLRFDGYYILMDLTEIPNLRQKSTEVLKRFMTELCLGIEQPENPFLPQRNRLFFALYTIAAVIYRWVVVFSICYFLNKVLEPYGLKVLGQLVAVAGLFGLVIQPLWQLGKFFYVPGRMHKVKQHRVVASLSVVAVLVLAVLYVPLPFHIDCTFEVQPRNAESVFAAVPGRLVQIEREPGDYVEAGEELARLENADLQLAVVKLQGERDRLQAQLESLSRRRHTDTRVISQIPTVQQMLRTVEEELDDKEEQLGWLTITAPVSGQVFPPTHRPKRESQDGRLPSWSGFPFDGKNQNAWIAERDQFCQIGDAEQYEAVLVIDQADINLLYEYQGDEQRGKGKWPEVDLKFDAYRSEVFSGRIGKVASAPMEVSPMSLASQGGGELNTKMDASGVLRPISTSYQARVSLEEIGMECKRDLLRVGLTGRAKVYTGWQPLGTRLARFLYRTFHFHW